MINCKVVFIRTYISMHVYMCIYVLREGVAVVCGKGGKAGERGERTSADTS